jgi:hypothetical protein
MSPTLQRFLRVTFYRRAFAPAGYVDNQLLGNYLAQQDKSTQLLALFAFGCKLRADVAADNVTLNLRSEYLQLSLSIQADRIPPGIYVVDGDSGFRFMLEKMARYYDQLNRAFGDSGLRAARYFTIGIVAFSSALPEVFEEQMRESGRRLRVCFRCKTAYAVDADYLPVFECSCNM